MLVLLALTSALACDPAESDIVQILPGDGTNDLPQDLRVFVRLGDVQSYDEALDVVFTDADGQVVEVELDTTHSNDPFESFHDWRLTPVGLLAPGSYRVAVTSPATRDAPVVASFEVGEALADAPPRPAVEIVDIEAVEEVDPCFGTHRIVTATLDPRDEADDASLIHVFFHLEGEEPDTESPGGRVLVSPGARMTLRFNTELPDDPNTQTCARMIVEGPNGERSALSEPDCGTPETDPAPTVEDEPGCRCASAPATPTAAWLAVPLLVATLRRRRR